LCQEIVDEYTVITQAEDSPISKEHPDFYVCGTSSPRKSERRIEITRVWMRAHDQSQGPL